MTETTTTSTPHNASHTCHFSVSEVDTAAFQGSGDLDVLATPRLVAGMEQAARLAVAAHLPEGSTTVGTAITIEHLHATPLGATWSATATLTKVDGRALHFTLEATDHKGTIGRGTHTRFIVDRQRFMSKL